MNMIKSLLLAVLLVMTCSAASAQESYRIVDNHLHYLDFIQQTKGFESLVKQMDECNVSHAVIFGMGMAKQWDEHAPQMPTYYLSNDSRCYYFPATDYIMMLDYVAQPQHIQDRFYPFICGINPNDRMSATYLRDLLEKFKGKIRGIGEIMSRHDDLTALTYGEPPHADHPAYTEILKLAVEYDIPVLIHHNISAVSNPDPIYLDEFCRMLDSCPEAKVIWAHVGISRRIEVKGLADIADDILTRYPNLYFDISWIVYEDYIAKDIDRWIELFEKHPTRFMIGSDIVGKWDNYTKEIRKYYPMLDAIKDQTLVENLCYRNILTLLKEDCE